MKDITFRSPPGWYLAMTGSEKAMELRVIDLVSACTEWHETGRLVTALAERMNDKRCDFLGSAVDSAGIFRKGDYVLVASLGATENAARVFKTGFIEETRLTTNSRFNADVTFLDGTTGRYPYSRMIWAQVPGPLKAFMDTRVCVKNCPLKKEGACMEKEVAPCLS